MAAVLCQSCVSRPAVLARRVSRATSARTCQRPATFLAAPRVSKRAQQHTAAAVPVEVAQIAGEAAVIGGTAGVMVGLTLIGLVFGFILLRVETLVEEGEL